MSGECEYCGEHAVDCECDLVYVVYDHYEEILGITRDEEFAVQLCDEKADKYAEGSHFECFKIIKDHRKRP